MSITEDSSTPAVKDSGAASTATSITTASFTPPAGSVLLAMLDINYNSYAAPTLTISDSAGGTWTSQVSQGDSGSFSWLQMWTRPCSSSPGSITVTVSRGSQNTSAELVLAVRVLNGAALTQSGGGNAKVGASFSNPSTVTVTTTQSGSLVYVLSNDSSYSSVGTTAQSGTTEIYNVADASDIGELMVGRATSATGTPGTGSPGALGWSNPGGHGTAVIGLEILPASGTTASAGLAAGTGTAQTAPDGIAPNAQLATGTGTAQPLRDSTAATAQLAAATAAAQSPTATTSGGNKTATAQLATAAAAAQSPGVQTGLPFISDSDSCTGSEGFAKIISGALPAAVPAVHPSALPAPAAAARTHGPRLKAPLEEGTRDFRRVTHGH